MGLRYKEHQTNCGPLHARPARIQSSRPARVAFYAALFLAMPAFLAAQSRPPTQVADSSALKPPAGARVALVVFSNMQCPACAHTWPLLRKAAATYHIPIVDHEVQIPSHNWAEQAALNALWFDAKSPAIGDAYRDTIFANQTSIYSPVMLRQVTDSFARSHNLQMPFALDPQGRLNAALQGHYNLANRTGVRQTPTIFIVASGGNATPFTEVLDQSQLYQLIDRALAQTRDAARPRTVHK